MSAAAGQPKRARTTVRNTEVLRRTRTATRRGSNEHRA